MKKLNLIFLLFVLSTLIILPKVSAQSFIGASDIVSSTVEAATSVFNPLFGALFGVDSNSELLLAKILLFLLLALILNVVLKKLPLLENQKGIALLVALIISIFAVRFMSESELTLGILLPYGTLGVAIWTIFPFIVFFYFLHATKIGSMGRRIAWMIFGIIWLVLWAARYQDFSPISNQIYWWTFFAMVLVFIFDKRIHGYFGAHELNVFYRGADQREIAALQAEYLNIINVDTQAASARRNAIKTRLAALGANPT